jgi:hypothetical protein
VVVAVGCSLAPGPARAGPARVGPAAVWAGLDWACGVPGAARVEVVVPSGEAGAWRAALEDGPGGFSTEGL